MRFGNSQDAKPTLLTWKSGRWVLQLEMLVPLGWELLRPTTRHIEGRDDIVYYLEQVPGWRGLGEAALRLFDGFVTADPAEDRSFEPRDGRWVPTVRRIGPLQLTAGNPLQGTQTPTEAVEAVRRLALRVALLESAAGGNREVTKLRRLVTALASSNDQLQQRVGELEARLARGEVKARSIPAPVRRDSFPAPPAPQDSSENFSNASDGADAGASARQVADEGVSNAQPSPAAETPVQVASPAESWPDPEPPRAPTGSALTPLTGSAITDGLSQLLSGQLTVLETAVLPDFPEQKGPWFHTTLVDADGQVLGALVGDWRATVYLGGGMLLLPPEELERLVQSREPTADVTDAMTEVFNTLQQQLAKNAANPAVSTSGATALDVAGSAWISEMGTRVDFAENHGGRLVFLSK